MQKILAVALAASLFIASAAPKSDDRSSWQNLQRLNAGDRIQVEKKNHDGVTGDYVAATGESISLRVKQQDVIIARPDVVAIHMSGRSHRAVWIGLAVGAGAGLAIGVAVAERLSNESGGDFAGLKPAVTAATAGVGALVGLVIGAVAGGHRTTIYKTK